MDCFSEKSLVALGKSYVYGLIDPRDNQFFYIGKGSDNRVFEHEVESLKHPMSVKLKLQRIKEIKDCGLEVKKVIIAYNLSDAEAYAAEAAVINAMNYSRHEEQLTNINAGHHNHYAQTVEEFENEYAAVELNDYDIKHNVIAIIINKLYERGMNDDQLYDVVRGCWTLDIERAKKCEYVFGVYNSHIKAVYKPSEWFPCTDKSRIPERDKNDKKLENRIYFVDNGFERKEPLNDDMLNYLGKSTSRIKKMSYVKGRMKSERYIPRVVDSTIVPDKLYYRVNRTLETIIDSRGICENMSYTKNTKDGPQIKNIYENTCKINAGQKRRETAIYELDCKALIKDKYYFYCDENNNFIVNEVPINYLRKIW